MVEPSAPAGARPPGARHGLQQPLALHPPARQWRPEHQRGHRRPPVAPPETLPPQARERLALPGQSPRTPSPLPVLLHQHQPQIPRMVEPSAPAGARPPGARHRLQQPLALHPPVRQRRPEHQRGHRPHQNLVERIRHQGHCRWLDSNLPPLQWPYPGSRGWSHHPVPPGPHPMDRDGSTVCEQACERLSGQAAQVGALPEQALSGVTLSGVTLFSRRLLPSEQWRSRTLLPPGRWQPRPSLPPGQQQRPDHCQHDATGADGAAPTSGPR